MNYLDALSQAHGALRPRNYVEIGCRFGSSLSLARCAALGIDPDFEIKTQITAPTRLYRMTSDEFFGTHDIDLLLGEPIDFAFIDGMHKAEFALRDFINLERAASPHGVIAIDDVLPDDLGHTTRERQTQFWTGDVYKLVLILKKFRPDLVIDIFDVDRKGFCMVSRLDPGSRALLENYGAHEASIMDGMYTSCDVESLRDELSPRSAGDIPSVLTELAQWRGGITPVANAFELGTTNRSVCLNADESAGRAYSSLPLAASASR